MDSDSDFDYREVEVETDSESDGDEDLSKTLQALRSPSSQPSAATVPQTASSRDERNGMASTWSLQEPPPAQEKCDALFQKKFCSTRIDQKSTKVISLVQIEEALRELLPNLDGKNVVMRAYRAADVNKDGRIGSAEFFLLVQFVFFFQKCWQTLETFEATHGRKLSFEGFKTGCSTLLGLDSSDNIQAEFDELDKNDNGYILFDEFCNWAAIRHTIQTGENIPKTSDLSTSDEVKPRSPTVYAEGALQLKEGGIWTNRYFAVMSRQKTERAFEKFELLCFDDEESSNQNLTPRFKLRIGEFAVTEGSGHTIDITNMTDSACLRAANKAAAVSWLVALRALQYAEMIHWSPSHMCRWLEAIEVPDNVLHCLHDRQLPGRFIARAIASLTNKNAALQELQEETGLPETEAKATIGKAQQLLDVDVQQWLVHKERELNGQSDAIAFAVAFMKDPESRRTSTGSMSDITSSHQHLAKRLALLQEQVSTLNSPRRQQQGMSFTRFSPQKWKEDGDRKQKAIEEKRLRAEMDELKHRMQQTSKANLTKRYPRDPSYESVESRYYAVHRREKTEPTTQDAGSAEPEPSDGVVEKGNDSKGSPKGPASPKRIAVEWAKTSTGLWASRRLEVDGPPSPSAQSPLEARNSASSPSASAGVGSKKGSSPASTRSPGKAVDGTESSIAVSTNDLPRQLEMLLESKDMAGCEAIVTAAASRLRRLDRIQREARRQKEVNDGLRERAEELDSHAQLLQQECMSYETMLREMQGASERALEKSSRCTVQIKEAMAEKQIMKAEIKNLQEQLQTEESHNDVLTRKVDYLQRQLREKLSAPQVIPGIAIESDELLDKVKDRDAKIEQLKLALKRQKRNAAVAKEEAIDRGKLLVGAASKLELAQETAESLRQEAVKWQNRVESAYSAKQTMESELRRIKRGSEKSTAVLRRVWELLGQKHRFNDGSDFDMEDLPAAIEEAVEKWSNHRKSATDKDKKINRLTSQVKDMERHLEREQAESVSMLEELQKAKMAASRELQTDNLIEVVETLGKMKQEVKMHQEQASYMRAQLAAKDLEVEQVQARSDAAVSREREKNFAQELELRQARATSLSPRQTVHDQEREAREARERQRLRAESMGKLRQRRQTTRLSQMYDGSEVLKYHRGKVKKEGRYLLLTEDNSALLYAKDRRSIAKGTRILLHDVRAVNFGFATDTFESHQRENEEWNGFVSEREWFCFSLILDERTVDFSCPTEATTALWVLGLRTLLHWSKQDYRGFEVGSFFWQRAAMKLRHYAIAGRKTRYRHLIEVVRRAAADWKEM